MRDVFEQIRHPELADAALELCETCDNPATKHDVNGIPLCEGCWEVLARETAATPKKQMEEPNDPR